MNKQFWKNSGWIFDHCLKTKLLLFHLLPWRVSLAAKTASEHDAATTMLNNWYSILDHCGQTFHQKRLHL